MKYQVQWVKKHLGVSRKALRNYEAKGLMPANEDRKYREYTEEDLDRIWTIRLFQGMGFTVQEIADMDNENYDLDEAMEKKIKELEEKKEKVDRLYGYARTIKYTGRVPRRPKELGSCSFEEFYQKTSNEWNIDNDPQMQGVSEAMDIAGNMSRGRLNEEDIPKLLRAFEKCAEVLNSDYVQTENLYIKEIIKRKDRGTVDPEVQLLIRMIYQNRLSEGKIPEGISEEAFSRYTASSFICGDTAKSKWNLYGKENCEFIADAIAVFGGYSNYFEMDD